MNGTINKVPRKLLERLQERLDPHIDARDWGLICDLLAQPSEPQGGEEVGHVPDSEFVDEFMTWWEKHGQFCRAGGGDYERTFAFQAWRHLIPRHRRLIAEQLERERKLAEALRSVRRSIQEAGLRTSLKTIDEALAAREKRHQ
jgi:hypothetical protein